MNFVKLYIGDYQRDTGHLSIAEHGAYLLMLQHYYATERPLPTGKALHRLLRAETRAEREAIDAVVRRFWTECDGGLVNSRADEEIAKASETELGGAARRASERQRQRRARDRRRALYETLRSRGVTPPFDATTAELEALVGNRLAPNVTRDGGATVTADVTRDITANQTPDTRHQTLKDSAADASVASPPEKRGEIAVVGGQESVESDPPQAQPKVPSCPLEQIVADYHATLPQLPRVLVRNDKRDGLIRARWREVFAAGKAADRGDGLALFHEYFTHVAQSRFLTGRAEARNGSPPFVADLEWLMRPTNFAKVVEGKYHRG